MSRAEVCHICRIGRLTNFKINAVGTRRAKSPTSAIASKAKGHGDEVTWSVWQSVSREGKVPETPKLVGALPTPLAITLISFKVKRSTVNTMHAPYAARGHYNFRKISLYSSFPVTGLHRLHGNFDVQHYSCFIWTGGLAECFHALVLYRTVVQEIDRTRTNTFAVTSKMAAAVSQQV